MFLAEEEKIHKDLKDARKIYAKTKDKGLGIRIVKQEAIISEGKNKHRATSITSCAKTISGGRKYFSTGPDTPQDFEE